MNLLILQTITIEYKIIYNIYEYNDINLYIYNIFNK